VNWTKIENIFTAVGGEQWYTIGNFYRLVNSDTLRVSNLPNSFGPCWNEGAGYYLDNLSLVEEDRAEAYFDTTQKSLCIKQGIPLQLGDTANRPWLQYEWRDQNNNIVGTNRDYTYSAALLESTFFTLKITDTSEYAFITKAIDTIFITTSLDPSTQGCNLVGLNDVLSDAEKIDFYYSDNKIVFKTLHERFTLPNVRSSEVEIISIDGRILFKTELRRKQNVYSINTELPKGFYFVEVIYEGQKIKRKKISPTTD
jgi:hypothetical protein